eukprot:746970-Hanusia_phi.AAC.5
MEVNAARVKVCPRPRGSALSYSPQEPVSLDQSLVKSLFHLTQCEAAENLGISLSSLKLACRRMGIKKWPYNRRNISRRTHNERIPETELQRNGQKKEMEIEAMKFIVRRPFWLDTSVEELLDESILHVTGNSS